MKCVEGKHLAAFLGAGRQEGIHGGRLHIESAAITAPMAANFPVAAKQISDKQAFNIDYIQRKCLQCHLSVVFL